MIASSRHRGLKALYEGGAARGAGACREAAILTALDLSGGPEGMNLPGFRLRELKGSLKGECRCRATGG